MRVIALLVVLLFSGALQADNSTAESLNRNMCTCGCGRTMALCYSTHPSCHQASAIKNYAQELLKRNELRHEMCSCGCNHQVSSCLDNHPSCRQSKQRLNDALAIVLDTPTDPTALRFSPAQQVGSQQQPQEIPETQTDPSYDLQASEQGLIQEAAKVRIEEVDTEQLIRMREAQVAHEWEQSKREVQHEEAMRGYFSPSPFPSPGGDNYIHQKNLEGLRQNYKTILNPKSFSNAYE